MMAPAPKALEPSTQTQAEVSAATQLTITAASLLLPLAGGAGAAENSTTFFHYGYLADEPYFAGGLRAGSFATTEGGLTGAEAQSTLSLPHATVPDAVYPVTPEPGAPVIGPTEVAPEYGQPGLGKQVQFPQGTGPGTVGPPRVVRPE
jgi:hypothetical protein